MHRDGCIRRSNSSAKEVHRGRQQKRISRQPLQSSSSSAAAAAAAVAAAGAEAAWRGLDRVRELRWQTIERSLQLCAVMFGCFGRGAGDELVAGRVRRFGGGDVKRGAVSQPSRSTRRERLERSMQRFYGRNLSSAVDPRCWYLGLGAKDEREYGSTWLARPR